uniref:Uncharacterized protein n=1 Tax=Globisporangium ultimum (strain ATCC 200006 / CBS 805.95 / DAOM BR144) TaxID=431595 RepID=K3WZC9_GLOUD
MSGGNFDLDHAYLRTTVAAPLAEAMAQLAILQPEDPVEYLGNYLLKFVENELENQRKQEPLKTDQQRGEATATPRHQGDSNGNSQDGPTSELDKTLNQEKNVQAQLQGEQRVPELFQRFIEWLCASLNAEEAYIGRKCTDQSGAGIVHWIASSRTPTSVMIDKFVAEERGVTFDVFKEIEDPAAPVDADGNPLPPSVPKYLHIENVLREPRMKFFHVPKLGAYLTKGLKFNSFLHPDVFNDANPETPNIKEDWIVVSVDTMGQARSFTQPEIDSFQRSCTIFIQAVEDLERNLYMKDFERKTTNDDAMLREFNVAYAAQIAVQEENLMIQLQSMLEEEKNMKEIELRAAFMMYLLTSHVPTLAMASTRIVPFKQPVLVAFAAALGLLGHPKQALYNPVTKVPSWEKIAPLLEETTLKACLEGFPVADPPSVVEAKQALSEVTKADIEAGSPIALCFYLWTQAVIAQREQLDALAKLARQQEADAVALTAAESEE